MIQENQLEAEAVSETDAVLDEDGNAVESEVVAEEVNTLEQFDTLTPEEKLEYVDEAGKVLIAEAEAAVAAEPKNPELLIWEAIFQIHYSFIQETNHSQESRTGSPT